MQDYYPYRYEEDAVSLLLSNQSPARRALGRLLLKISEALSTIQYNNDHGRDGADEETAISAVFGANYQGAVLHELLMDAKTTQAWLEQTIQRIEAGEPICAAG